MRNSLRCRSHWLRGLALAAISALGIVAIVASGGGGVPVGGIPPYTGPGASGDPQPSVRVAPPYVTALAGTTVTFTAEASDAQGGVGYQWARSFDVGKTFVDIAGATDRSYSLGGVTLGDDAAVFRVRLKVLNYKLYETSAFCWLAVAATPGVVFEDGEFLPENWVSTTDGQRVTSGGNPGAFRQMDGASGAVRTFHTYRSAAFDPASEGPIYVIDFEEDCTPIQWSGSPVPQVFSHPMIEQAGRKYVASSSRPWEVYGIQCGETTWRKIRRSSLGSRDFTLAAGPECNVGQSCPDFSAAGLPMRFGYERHLSGGGLSVSMTHGIDNWKVTVWKR
jgi:hypothetical protein